MTAPPVPSVAKPKHPPWHLTVPPFVSLGTSCPCVHMLGHLLGVPEEAPASEKHRAPRSIRTSLPPSPQGILATGGSLDQEAARSTIQTQFPLRGRQPAREGSSYFVLQMVGYPARDKVDKALTPQRSSSPPGCRMFIQSASGVRGLPTRKKGPGLRGTGSEEVTSL